MTKQIPKFKTPSEQTRDIDGLPVKVRRLPATRAPDVLSRLFSDVGPEITRIISTPEEDLDPDVEDAIRGLIATNIDPEASVEITLKIIKAIIFSGAIGRVKEFDLRWYAEQLLIGTIEIDGVSIDSMAELDETDIMPMTLVEMCKFAFEVNFFPTSAERGTSHGGSRPAEKSTETKDRNPIGKSSLRGATKRAGR